MNADSRKLVRRGPKDPAVVASKAWIALLTLEAGWGRLLGGSGRHDLRRSAPDGVYEIRQRGSRWKLSLLADGTEQVLGRYGSKRRAQEVALQRDAALKEVR